MHATEITYTRLSKQRVERYENETASVTLTLDERDDPQVAMQAAKRLVDEALGLVVPQGRVVESKVSIEQEEEF